MYRQIFCCLPTILLAFTVSTAKAVTPLAIRVEAPIALTDNLGDTWVAAWAADGTVYTPSDDTKGFHSATSSNIAFNKVLGDDARKLSGVTINPMSGYGKEAQQGPDGCTWKSSGCYCLDGTIYWVVARHKYGESSGDPKRRQSAGNASIIKSTDFGKTWTRSASENYDQPMFPGSRFATPYFVEYGQDGRASVDNADRYVYALSNDGFWDNGNNLILGRVARSKIGDLRASRLAVLLRRRRHAGLGLDIRHGAGQSGARCAGQAGHERRCLRAGTAALYHDRLVLSGRRRQDERRQPHDELGFL